MKTINTITVCILCFFAGIAIAVISDRLDCLDGCRCSGKGTEGCTCITAAAVACPCRDCPCESAYHSKAALEDIKALKSKIEKHCCEANHE